MPVVEPVKNCRGNPDVICVGYGLENTANACRGDSGGPLMCENRYVTKTIKYEAMKPEFSAKVRWLRVILFARDDTNQHFDKVFTP